MSVSDKEIDDLVEELSPLILKSQLGILDYAEIKEVKWKLIEVLKLKGYNHIVDLIGTFPKSEEDKKEINDAINEVFPCSPSKTAGSTTKADRHTQEI